jgi:hypothetical protein
MFDTLELFTGMDEDEDEKDELDRFLGKDMLKVDNPIKWWLSKSSLYPSLSRMALDYLMIPGKSCLFLYHYAIHHCYSHLNQC